tara:strand:- start:45 stop:254 length:210 start_codon:yes stop_codon:yes gene_type:complete
MLLEDKRGFIDGEVLMSAGFIILAAMAIGATALGYIFAKKSGMDVFPTWQLILIIGGELVAAYIFAARG